MARVIIRLGQKSRQANKQKCSFGLKQFFSVCTKQTREVTNPKNSIYIITINNQSRPREEGNSVPGRGMRKWRGNLRRVIWQHRYITKTFVSPDKFNWKEHELESNKLKGTFLLYLLYYNSLWYIFHFSPMIMVLHHSVFHWIFNNEATSDFPCSYFSL